MRVVNDCPRSPPFASRAKTTQRLTACAERPLHLDQPLTATIGLKQAVSRLSKRERAELQAYLIRLRHNKCDCVKKPPGMRRRLEWA
jgi:hypothetical protein